MRNFIVLLFMLFILNKANAQDLKWSQPQKMTERAYITEVVGQNSEGIFIIRKNYRQSDRNVTLEHYNNDMKLLDSKSFATNKDEYFAHISMNSKELLLFYATENKDRKEISLNVKHLSFNLNMEGKDSVIFTMPGPDFSDRKLEVYKTVNSPHSLFLFTKQTMEIPSNYSYFVIDTALNKITSGEFDINVPNMYDIEGLAYTQTNIGLLVREDVKRKVNRQGYQYTIWEGKFGEQNLKPNTLYNDSIIVSEGILKADNLNEQLVFAGLYNKKDSTYAKGFCVWKHDLKNNSYSFTKQIFPQRAIAELSGKNAKVQGIYNLRSGDMILRKDGGIVLTSEEYEETREAVMDVNMYGVAQSNFRYYYYYENMLILSINPQGTLDWHTVLRKEQVSVNDNGVYSSYSISALPDKLVYLYNDLSRKSWNLSLYEVNSDGIAHSKIVLRAQDYEAKLVPQYAKQISYDEMIVPGMGRKGYVLLKLKL